MSFPFEIAERDHDIQNPTSPEKVGQLGAHLRLDASHTVLDVACGKAGPAIILAKEFGCTVIGVEVRPAFADEARRRVAAAGLDDRISIETADARTYAPSRRFDVAMCLGAAFVWGHIGDAAAALLPHVVEGGAVVVGEPFLRSDRLPDAVDSGGWVSLVDTVARFEAPGLRLIGLIAGAQDEWDRYESLHWRALDDVRQQDLQVRDEYLRAREHLGWAMFAGRR